MNAAARLVPLEGCMMFDEIWPHGLRVLFVGAVATEPSPTLEFHHLHPRDRFWELLDLGGITKGRVITKEERKAMADGHARGNITDPVRQIFLEKKRNQLVRLGIGITYLNRSPGIGTEKDKAALPAAEDLTRFVARAEATAPRCFAFVMDNAMFKELWRPRCADATDVLGKQPFTIAGVPVWLMGSAQAVLKGDALLAQEDQFFALGEYLGSLADDT